MAAQYVDTWSDADLCIMVLLKCISNLSPAHPLRPAIAFKYNLILIVQVLPVPLSLSLSSSRSVCLIMSLCSQEVNKAMPPEAVESFLLQLEKRDGAISRPRRMALLRMFQSWQGFQQECRNDLGTDSIHAVSLSF